VASASSRESSRLADAFVLTPRGLVGLNVLVELPQILGVLGGQPPNRASDLGSLGRVLNGCRQTKSASDMLRRSFRILAGCPAIRQIGSKKQARRSRLYVRLRDPPEFTLCMDQSPTVANRVMAVSRMKRIYTHNRSKWSRLCFDPVHDL
jgi:hypothetical protein